MININRRQVLTAGTALAIPYFVGNYNKSGANEVNWYQNHSIWKIPTKIEKIFKVADEALCRGFYEGTKGAISTLHSCKIEVLNNSRTSIRAVSIPLHDISYGHNIDFPLLTEIERSELEKMFKEKYTVTISSNKQIAKEMRDLEIKYFNTK
jgi:hypothetical protein